MKHKKPRILLISYAFFPLSAPEAILNAKALACLDDFELDVLTIDPISFGLSIDPSLESIISKRVKILPRITYPSWLPKILFEWAKYLSPLPDRFRLLNGRALKQALKAGIGNYDVVMTWSQWHSVHLVGAAIKMKHQNIKWVAHFSDPWSDNPFLPNLIPLKYLHKRMESKVFKLADQLHFTSKETLRLLKKTYGASIASKSFIVPHCFDETLLDRTIDARKDEIVFRYMGNFYGARNPRNFIAALSELDKQRPEILRNVKIEFYGRWIDVKEPEVEVPNKLQDKVKFFPSVSYLASLRLMATANILLIIDAPFDFSVFFPSKLIDYMSLFKPILAITPMGTTSKVIREYGGVTADPDDGGSIMSGINSVMKQYNCGELAAVNREFANSFEVNQVKKIYQMCLNEVLR